MGGHQGVGDLPQIDWLREEADFIHTLLVREHPFLGICLGAQLMAHVLGHRVSSCPQKQLNVDITRRAQTEIYLKKCIIGIAMELPLGPLKV